MYVRFILTIRIYSNMHSGAFLPRLRRSLLPDWMYVYVYVCIYLSMIDLAISLSIYDGAFVRCGFVVNFHSRSSFAMCMYINTHVRMYKHLLIACITLAAFHCDEFRACWISRASLSPRDWGWQRGGVGIGRLGCGVGCEHSALRYIYVCVCSVVT